MANYTPDRRGIGRYLQYSPELKRELLRRAILGQGVAIGLAPRRTGRLAASSEVRDDGPNGGVRRDRMQYSVHFTVGYAVPASFPDRDERAYLEAAIVAMERGN